jgi:acyl dehydratase
MLTVLDIDLARVLHGEQSFTYHAPVLIGDTLTFRPRVASVIEKKDGALTLIVIECKVINQKGVHVADAARTVVVRNKVTS